MLCVSYLILPQHRNGRVCSAIAQKEMKSVLTVNAQEQREVGVLALSPLGDNAADRVQILQAAGQLPVQLVGQAGAVSGQGLRRHLRLPQPLLQRQVLLNQLLVLHRQLGTGTGTSGAALPRLQHCSGRAGAALLQAVARGANVTPQRDGIESKVPHGTALSLPSPLQ